MTPADRYRAAQGSDYVVPPEANEPPRFTIHDAFAIGQIGAVACLIIIAALVWGFS